MRNDDLSRPKILFSYFINNILFSRQFKLCKKNQSSNQEAASHSMIYNRIVVLGLSESFSSSPASTFLLKFQTFKTQGYKVSFF